MDNVEVSKYELLAEDPETLKELLPTLVGMALPMLTDALKPIEIPRLRLRYERFRWLFNAVAGGLALLAVPWKKIGDLAIRRRGSGRKGWFMSNEDDDG